jgi:hypothetical protein
MIILQIIGIVFVLIITSFMSALFIGYILTLISNWIIKDFEDDSTNK